MADAERLSMASGETSSMVLEGVRSAYVSVLIDLFLGSLSFTFVSCRVLPSTNRCRTWLMALSVLCVFFNSSGDAVRKGRGDLRQTV